MGSYYYLVASLPDLHAGEKMPISYPEFLKLCEGNVSKEEYELLRTLNLEKPGNRASKKWAEFYGVLSMELIMRRSELLGKPFLKEFDRDEDIAALAASALSAKNPLEAELFLLEKEFENLDDIVGDHYFDGIYLFVYAIKLRLLERRSCFDKEKGREEFRRIMDTVSERVYGI